MKKVKTLNCKKESKKGCNNKSTNASRIILWDKLEQHINNFFEKVKLEVVSKKIMSKIINIQIKITNMVLQPTLRVLKHLKGLK